MALNHKLVTECNTGASLHYISLFGLDIPSRWDPWEALTTGRKTVSLAQCGLPVSAFVDMLLRERSLQTIRIAEHCVITGNTELGHAKVPACKLRIFHALSYGNGFTIFSFPYLLSAVIAACEFIVDLCVRVAPDQSDALARLLIASVRTNRLTVAFGPGKSGPIFIDDY